MINPGDIIISSPYADTGIVFSKSVIYIMAHDNTGTSGVIINKLLKQVKGKSILEALNLHKVIPNMRENKISDLSVYFGGPIEQEKGIILHSSDYKKNALINEDPEILINIDNNILQDIILGAGPIHKMLVMGYTSWAPNQLLAEIKRNDWLMPLNNIDKKTIYNLIFAEEHQSRWNKALELTGVNLSNYSNTTGNA